MSASQVQMIVGTLEVLGGVFLAAGILGLCLATASVEAAAATGTSGEIQALLLAVLIFLALAGIAIGSSGLVKRRRSR